MLKECIDRFQTDDAQLKNAFFFSKLLCSASIYIPVSAQAVILEVIPVCWESEQQPVTLPGHLPRRLPEHSGSSGLGSALWLPQELILSLLPSVLASLGVSSPE